MKLDSCDKSILSLLQRDATLTTADIAEKVGLSSTPCWRRIQRLHEAGVIKRTVALLSAEQLKLHLTVFVHVKAAKHDSNWLKQFARHATSFDEVVDVYRLSGEYDYMLKVLVSDMQGYDHFYKRFIAGIELSDVTSSFAMETMKNSTALPLYNA